MKSSVYPPEVIDEVNSRLDIRELMRLIDYRFDKFQDGAKTAKGYCPVHREGLFRNLVITKKARTFKCQYTQCPASEGGNLVTLYSLAKGIGFDDALRDIVEQQELGVQLPVDEGQIAAQVAAASTELESENPDRAREIIASVLTAVPDSLPALDVCQRIQKASGEQDARLETIARIVGIHKAKGTVSECADLAKEWTELVPGNPDAAMAMAEVVLSSGDPEASILEFMSAGDACEASGNLDDALAAYRRVEQIASEKQVDVIDATPHIVRVLCEMGRKSEAAAYLKELSDLARDAEDFTYAGELMVSAIETDPEDCNIRRRFVELAPALEPTPELAGKLFETSDFFLANDARDDAVATLEFVHSRWPESEEALRRLINEYNNCGKSAESLDLEAELARRLDDLDRTDEALEIVNRVLQWQPEHVPSLTVQSEIHDKAGRDLDARESRRRMVRAMIGRSDFTRAEEILNPLLKKEPKAEDLLDLQASVIEGMARGGKDRNAARKAVKLLVALGDRALGSPGGSRAAIAYFTRALNLDKSPPADLHFKLAKACLDSKDTGKVRDHVIHGCEVLAGRDKLDEAILQADSYCGQLPDDSDLVFYLAELYLRFDDKASAVARLRKLAASLAEAGRAEEAEEIFEKALEFEPGNADTLTEQAQMHLRAGNQEKYARGMIRLASLHENTRDFDQAFGTIEQGISHAPEDVSLLNRAVYYADQLKNHDAARSRRMALASIHHRNGDYELEARALRDILARRPDDEKALAQLMECGLKQKDPGVAAAAARKLAAVQIVAGRTDAAKKTLLGAVDRCPENAELLHDLFDFHREAQQSKQAISWGRRLVLHHIRENRIPEAASVYERLVDLDPDDVALRLEQIQFLEEQGRTVELTRGRMALATHYQKNGQYDECEEILHAVVAVDPRSTVARERLADLYRRRGDDARAENELIALAGVFNMQDQSERAVSILRGILEKNPANHDARRQLVQVHRSSGNPAEAVRELHAMSDVFLGEEKTDEAVELEKEAVELAPGDVSARRRLADTLVKCGKASAAADALEDLARLQVDRGLKEHAIAALGEAVGHDPARLSARKLRGELYSGLGQTDKALKEFQVIAELATSGGFLRSNGSGYTGHSLCTLELVREYNFENFVVGSGNEFAHATALAIARNPAATYNPLFLHAEVGLGKTHLCNSIANFLLEKNADYRIIYTNSEDFTGELIHAIQKNEVQQFRNHYRNLDLLIVDDVQFLAGKERAQEEFFHIFNSLFQAKRQIVITSDRPPSDIAHLENRLRSRFGAGVIVDIASPDLETRLAILQRDIEASGKPMDSFVPMLLASHIETNIRDLKGALNQVTAMRDLRQEAVTEQSVQAMLHSLYPRPVPV